MPPKKRTYLIPSIQGTFTKTGLYQVTKQVLTGIKESKSHGLNSLTTNAKVDKQQQRSQEDQRGCRVENGVVVVLVGQGDQLRAPGVCGGRGVGRGWGQRHERRALPDLSGLICPAPNTVPGTLLLKYRFLKIKRLNAN